MTAALRATAAAVIVVTHDRQMLRDLVGGRGDDSEGDSRGATAWPVLRLA